MLSLSPLPSATKKPNTCDGSLRSHNSAGCVRRSLFAFIASTLLAVTTPAEPATLFVTATGGGDYSGSSWSNAMATISASLLVAEEGDEIWVATGRYEEHIHNRVVGDVAINVALYGGFAGGEGSLVERDIGANPTVIDGTGSGIVVTITEDAGYSTRIDGFYITGGSGSDGGGIRIVTAAPVIANNTIYLNQTNGLGAGIHISGASAFGEHPQITGNTIVENYAIESAGEGGAIGLNNSNASIIDNVIARNQASQNGGGIAIHSDSQPLISHNFILANSANVLPPGTGMNEMSSETCWVGGGGVFATSFSPDCVPVEGAVCSPTIVNNFIAANGAYLGGGSALLSTDGTATFTNNTIVANSGAGVYWSEATLDLANNLVAFNSEGLVQVAIGTTYATLRHNNVFGNELQHRETDYVGVDDPTGTDGNISADPLLANLLTGDLHIQPGSPCTNSGDNAAITGVVTDLDGDARVIGSAVDIGADESDGTLWSAVTPVVYVRADGNDGDDGTTWGTAKASVQSAINQAATNGGEVWVAGGEAETDIYEEHLEIPAFVQLYGGFAGTESDQGARDWHANPTVLDGGGEIGVVRFVNAGYLISRLDGFVVQNGGLYTGGTPPAPAPPKQGGGVVSSVSGPIIANNTIQHNSLISSCVTPPCPSAAGSGFSGYMTTAVITGNLVQENEIWDPFDGSGGGLYFELSTPAIEDNVIRANQAKYGAGIYSKASTPLVKGNLIEQNSMYSDYITPTHGALWANFCMVHLDLGNLCGEGVVIESNVFRGNSAYQGAGVCLWDIEEAQVENNLFIDNLAFDYSGVGDGGFGGGLLVSLSALPEGDVRVTNNTFIGNSATHSFFGERGGAIAVTGSSDAIVVANNVIASNSSGIWQDPHLPDLDIRVLDCNDLYDNGGLDYVNVTPGLNDLALDPQFIDSDGRLGPSSPCLDGGSPVELPQAATDLDGAPRLRDADWDGDIRVDIGAYEYRTAYGIDVTPTSGLVTSEDGDTAQFSVALYSAPAADVTIDLASSDLGEGSISAATLTFTAGNWSAQQAITVTGVNDDIEDSGQLFSVITHPSTSADPVYASLNAADVSVLNRDDLDCGGFDVVVVDSRIFPPGDSVVCSALQSLSTTGLVTVPDAAVVTFSAPEIALCDGFAVEQGGTFRMP